MLPDWLVVGAVIRSGPWTGVVEDIYLSQKGKIILALMMVKNVFKDQGPDILPYERVAGILSPASFKELCEEMQATEARVKRGLDALTCLVDEELL